jgi:TIR domain
VPAGKVGMMARGGRRDRVFISYRRADSAGHAGRLEDELTRILGDRIFMDVSDIAPGADFERVLNDELASCGVVLAVLAERRPGHRGFSLSGGRCRVQAVHPASGRPGACGGGRSGDESGR